MAGISDDMEASAPIEKPKPEAQSIGERLHEIESKPHISMFQMPIKAKEYNYDAQENAVQKTLRLIKERQNAGAHLSDMPMVQPYKKKSFFPMFSNEDS